MQGDFQNRILDLDISLKSYWSIPGAKNVQNTPKSFWLAAPSMIFKQINIVTKIIKFLNGDLSYQQCKLHTNPAKGNNTNNTVHAMFGRKYLPYRLGTT